LFNLIYFVFGCSHLPIFFIFEKILRLIQSKYITAECELLQKLIDKGKKPTIDDDYARLLNRFEHVFDRFIEMANKICVPVPRDLVKKYKDTRNTYDTMDSLCVTMHLDHFNMNDRNNNNNNEDLRIIFENGISQDIQNKACCNEKCTIF
jgi:hypothetical protein